MARLYASLCSSSLNISTSKLLSILVNVTSVQAPHPTCDVDALLTVKITKLCANDFIEYLLILEIIRSIDILTLKQTVLFPDFTFGRLTLHGGRKIRDIQLIPHIRCAESVSLARELSASSAGIKLLNLQQARRGYIDRTQGATHRSRLHRKRIFR